MGLFENFLFAETCFRAKWGSIRQSSKVLAVSVPKRFDTIIHSGNRVLMSKICSTQYSDILISTNMISACVSWLNWWQTCVNKTFWVGLGGPETTRTGHTSTVSLHVSAIPMSAPPRRLRMSSFSSRQPWLYLWWRLANAANLSCLVRFGAKKDLDAQCSPIMSEWSLTINGSVSEM